MAYSIVSKKRQAVVTKAKPWQSTSGAVTEAGRSTCSQNRTVHGLHSREFLTIRRALSEAEALLAEGDLVSPSPKEENQPYFAEEQEPFFAEDMPAFYANPNSKTQPTLSAGAE